MSTNGSSPGAASLVSAEALLLGSLKITVSLGAKSTEGHGGISTEELPTQLIKET